jgi:hypothetical protein
MLFRDRPLVVNLCYMTVANTALPAAARFTAIVEDEKHVHFSACVRHAPSNTCEVMRTLKPTARLAGVPSVCANYAAKGSADPMRGDLLRALFFRGSNPMPTTLRLTRSIMRRACLNKDIAQPSPSKVASLLIEALCVSS